MQVLDLLVPRMGQKDDCWYARIYSEFIDRFYSRLRDGGFTPTFWKSPLFFRRRGEIFNVDKEGKVLKLEVSVKYPIYFSNPRIDTEIYINKKDRSNTYLKTIGKIYFKC